MGSIGYTKRKRVSIFYRRAETVIRNLDNVLAKKTDIEKMRLEWPRP